MYKIFKNNRSQLIFVSLMVAIMVLIVTLIISPVLKEEVSKARNTTQLNASNPDISVVNKATVIVLDMTLFYFIGTMIAASIAFITGRRSFTGVISAIMVFIVVSILITPLKDLIILLRDSSHLDCTNAAITVGGKLSCIIVDIWLFYFVITCIAVAATFIFATKVLPKIKGE